MAEETMFDVARREASLDAVAGRYVKLRGPDANRRGSCPWCFPKRALKGGGSTFQAKLTKKTWRTFCCDRFGDVTDLYCEMERVTPVEAVRALVGSTALPAPKPRAEPREREKTEGPSQSDRIAAELWRAGVPFAGTLGEKYLLGRGIAPEVVKAAAANLRFHPRANRRWDDERRKWTFAPAMLMLVVAWDFDQGRARATGGVHATYLTPQGRKAEGDDAKRMWGPQQIDGRPGGAWLIGPGTEHADEGPTATAEGAENALSVATLEFRRSGRIIRTCAALSLNRLQGGLARDNEGRIDPFDPQPSPDAPAFVWPGLGEVLIGIDRDMKPVRVKARTPRGRTCDYTLDAEARARLCARFASAAWAAVGASPRPIWPSAKSDLNDDLRRVLALSGQPLNRKRAA
ncbi:MAG: hypothetical protein DI552_00215 [Brevundimonas sp.]|uniref:DUF7146 domain-containing protein n=1 Tax=Brevundimonas sp. TaxID=1871086 RepID=UPI000DBC3FA3|nr:hypothetical protein [Brevundimonas sp.]PZU62328.1 MAG: hypothetical protein DI552_00215 [Brevundimonas sp.]